MHKSKYQSPRFLMLLVITTVFLSGCFFNPITGRYGPSWEVPLRIPLISNETTILELLEEKNYISSSLNDVLQAELTEEQTICFDEISFTTQSVEIQIPKNNISPPENYKVDINHKFDPTHLIENGTVEEIRFIGGHATFKFNEGANVTIDSITLGEKSSDGEKIALEGVTLTKNTEFTIKCNLSSGEHGITNVIVEFEIESSDIDYIRGNNLCFEIPEIKFPLEFELPDELDNLKFRNAELKLVVDYESALNNPPEINLREIYSLPLTMPQDTTFIGQKEFSFKKEEVTNLLNGGAEEIRIGGKVLIGENSLATFSFEDCLKMKFELIVPFEFELTEDIIYDSEIFPIDIDKDTIETLNKLTNQIHGKINQINRLPLDTKLELYVSNEEKPLREDAIKIEVKLEGADTDSEGLTISAKEKEILVEIPDEIRTILKQKANAQLRLTIQAPQNGMITFSQNDYIKISAWIELMAKVNK